MTDNWKLLTTLTGRAIALNLDHYAKMTTEEDVDLNTYTRLCGPQGEETVRESEAEIFIDKYPRHKPDPLLPSDPESGAGRSLNAEPAEGGPLPDGAPMDPGLDPGKISGGYADPPAPPV